MLKEALEYFNQGLNIVPVSCKKPITDWKKWQTQRQTKEEFEALPFDGAEGFAIVCGTKADNGSYFLSIDADSSDFDLKLLPITHMERTPRGGYHFYYWSRENARGVKNHFLKVELLGLGNIAIVYPTKGYMRLNDNTPTELANVNNVFQGLIERLGGRPQTQAVDIKTILKGVQIGDRDNSAIKLATYYRKHGLDDKKALEKLMEWDKLNEQPLGMMVLAEKVNSAFKKEEAYRFNFNDEKFSPAALAKEIMQDYKFITPTDMDILYVFDKELGAYSDKAELLVKAEMVKRLDEETRNRYFADVLFYIKGSTYAPKVRVSPYFIVCKNGVLNVVSRELGPFDSKLFITVKIPVAYDAQAECVEIRKFLEQVVGEEQVPILQEIFGYCLFQAMPFHKAVMLIGDGANGKSTLLLLLKAFLGSENTSNVTLQDICLNRFASALLHGKLANLCADLPDTAIVNSGRFKMLTGNDTISGEFKFKTPFSFINHAKMIFSANKIPQASEDTIAFFRRWLIIACNNVFMGEKCDPKIIEKLITEQELSGLLNFALDGLKRLLEKGYFSINETVEEMRAEYIRKSNSAKAFIEEQLVYVNDPKTYIEESELYQNFIFYCQKENLPTTPKRTLTINMQEFMPNAKQTKQRILGKPMDVWQFVKITPQTTQTKLKTVPSVPASKTDHSVPSVPSAPSLTQLLDEENKNNVLDNPEGTAGTVEPSGKKTIKVKHTKTTEPCFNGCPLLAEWEVNDDGNKILMCNECFNNARKNSKDEVIFEFVEESGF